MRSRVYLQRLPEKIGSFKSNVKLNILKETLPEIHPVDLADILEELPEEQRIAIFNELETLIQMPNFPSLKFLAISEGIELTTPASSLHLTVTSRFHQLLTHR
jgi:hypothetical protein